MANRQKILTQKAEEIRAQLEEWAKQNLTLRQFEFISIVLKIEKRPIVAIKQVATRTPRLKTTDKPILEKDWKKILSLRFSQKQKAIISFFKKNNNKPLSPLEIDKLLSESSFGGSFSNPQLCLLNSVFCKLKVNYRLRKTSGRHWEKTPLKFVIVEEK